jgi:hypothetical protein
MTHLANSKQRLGTYLRHSNVVNRTIDCSTRNASHLLQQLWHTSRVLC